MSKERFQSFGGSVTIVLLLCIVLGLTHAGATSDPSDQFLLAYQFAQQAQRLERTGDLESALRKYELALKLLEDIYADHPTEDPNRSPRRLREKVRSLRQQLHIPEASLQTKHDASSGTGIRQP